MSHKSKKRLRSAQFATKRRKFPRNSASPDATKSAQFRKSSKASKTLLTSTPKKRGPKQRAVPSMVLGTSNRYRLVLEDCKEQINWKTLVKASSEDDIQKAFENVPESIKQRLFLVKPHVYLACVHESTFPRKNQDAQIRYLCDSIAAEGFVSTRRSRDICYQERKRISRRGRIIRREFYIECTCGYKGPAWRGGCPQCGALDLRR